MNVNIIYTKKFKKNLSSNTIFFVDEKFNTTKLKKNLSKSEFSYINDLLKTKDLKKNLIIFEINFKKKIILVSIKKDLNNSDIEKLGAE